MRIASLAPKPCTSLLAMASAYALLAVSPAFGQAPPVSSVPVAAVAGDPATPAQQYCSSIADAAADARFAWQAETLADLEKQIDERIAELEAKRAEYEAWLARREDFLSRAEEGLVAIYAKMRPDAAALQLSNMGVLTAAAVLSKLNPRTASTILNEMEPARAAHLTTTMAGTAEKPRDDES